MNEVLTDLDGNQYKTVKIGTQIWMAENLKVTRYRNGDAILVLRNRREFEYHWYNPSVYISEDDTSGYLNYGYLYSSSIIFDERNIAPAGWHIPNLEEWGQLVNYLGGKEVAGRKLKSKDGWKREKNQPSTYRFKICEFGGTNESGFTALPSGRMTMPHQTAFDVGMYAWYWAADIIKVSESKDWFGYFNLNYSKGDVSMGCTYIEGCLSIRCIKDQ